MGTQQAATMKPINFGLQHVATLCPLKPFELTWEIRTEDPNESPNTFDPCWWQCCAHAKGIPSGCWKLMLPQDLGIWMGCAPRFESRWFDLSRCEAIPCIFRSYRDMDRHLRKNLIQISFKLTAATEIQLNHGNDLTPNGPKWRDVSWCVFVKRICAVLTWRWPNNASEPETKRDKLKLSQTPGASIWSDFDRESIRSKNRSAAVNLLAVNILRR